MPRKKTKEKTEFTQVETVLFNWDTGKYLKIGSGVSSIPYKFPQTWQYFRSTERDFQVDLFDWVDDKSSATEIPVGQVEDFICWIHFHTNFIVDRAARISTF